MRNSVNPIRTHHGAFYLKDVFDARHRYIDAVTEKVKSLVRCRKKTEKPDTIAVIGASGLLVGTVVAYKLNMDLLVVRKKDDVCHSSHKVEGMLGGRYIVIDDIVESGATVAYVVTQIKQADRNVSNRRERYESRCVGILCYNDQLAERRIDREVDEKKVLHGILVYQYNPNGKWSSDRIGFTSSSSSSSSSR